MASATLAKAWKTVKENAETSRVCGAGWSDAKLVVGFTVLLESGQHTNRGANR